MGSFHTFASASNHIDGLPLTYRSAAHHSGAPCSPDANFGNVNVVFTKLTGGMK